MRSGILAASDRIAADVFGKSYREFLAIKPTHYRWSHLAPQSVAWLETAVEFKWSPEKIADYLNCEVEEAKACLRRFIVSKKVNSIPGEAGKLRQALAEWVAMQPGMEDLPEAEKNRRAGELALIVANHLFAAADSQEDIMKLSKDLEGEASPEAEKRKPSQGSAESPKWGPQWKD